LRTKTKVDINVKVSKSQSKQKLRTASLDRIDSTKNYTIDNIQWVHKDVNKMKMDFSQEYFIEMCRLVTLTCKDKQNVT